MGTTLHSESGDHHEQWASSKELVVTVTELSAELSRMKAVIGHLEAERTSQDVWLKERWGPGHSSVTYGCYNQQSVQVGRQLNLVVWSLEASQLKYPLHVYIILCKIRMPIKFWDQTNFC